MKKIIYNYDNISNDEINNIVKRARALIVNSDSEILFGYADKTYHLIGGHLEGNEDYLDCLIREVREESGILLNVSNITPFLQIEYYSKDYPDEGVNTKNVINYYIIKTDMKPDSSKMELTDEEKEWNYTVKYIYKDKALKVLKDNIKFAKNKAAVYDTMEAVIEYLRIEDE